MLTSASRVGIQRTKYKQADHGSLTGQQIKLLESIGFIWDKLAFDWSQNYRELVSCFDAHGHSSVPYLNPQNNKLATCVSVQRRAYKNGKCTDDRIALLERVNFNWLAD